MFSAIKSKFKSFISWWIHYRIKFNDYLPWLAIQPDHVVLLKTGGFMVVLEIQFHDLFAAGDDEIETINSALNRIIKQFSDHTFYIEVAQRRYYPEESGKASNVAEKIIIDEQKQYFRDHPFYEKKFYLSIVYTPKSNSGDKFKAFFFPNGKNKVSDKDIFIKNRKEFIKSTNRIKGMLQGCSKSVKILKSDELVSFLHSCISSRKKKISFKNLTVPLDLTDERFGGGLYPKIGELNIGAICIKSPPKETYPMFLEKLNDIGCEYRLCMRYIGMPTSDAKREVERFQREWRTKIIYLWSYVRNILIEDMEPILKPDDQYAENLSEECVIVNSGLDADSWGLGLFSFNLIIYDADQNRLQENIDKAQNILDSLGMISLLETYNAVEAFFSSIPGNCAYNIRRTMITSLNLADFIPCSSAFSGQKWNHNLKAPALFIARSNNIFPFWFCNFWGGDVGNTLIAGPIGSGKSFISIYICTFFRLIHPNAIVVIFDFGNGAYVPTAMVGGKHYYLGKKGGLRCAPLKCIKTESSLSFIFGWLIELLALEDLFLENPARNELRAALKILSELPVEQITFRNLISLVMDKEIRRVLTFYSSQEYADFLLDADDEDFNLCSWTTVETKFLKQHYPKLYVLVMKYMFFIIHEKKDGRPVMLLTEEVGSINNPEYSSLIETELRTGRKENISLIYNTTSVSDIVNSPIASVLQESLSTKILLPNPALKNKQVAADYRAMGISDEEISKIQEAIQKQESMVINPLGTALISLCVEPDSATAAICGSCMAEDVRQMQILQEKYGDSQETLVKKFLEYKEVKP